MKATLEYRDDFLYVVEQKGRLSKSVKEWRPVRRAERAEVQTLLGRPVTSINQQEGIYVDEEGNIFQLADEGETKPIAVEHLPGTEKTEIEALLEASLKEGRRTDKTAGSSGSSKRIEAAVVSSKRCRC